jgi:hypothetical protein
MANDLEYAEHHRAKSRGKYNPEKAKAYYEANKEKLRAQGREWYAKNPERAKEYYKQNKEKMCKAVKEWIKANPERHKANRKEYETANKEKLRAQSKASAKRRYEENPQKIREQRKAVKQRQFEKDPAAYVAKRNAILRRSAKRKVDEVRDNYVAHLLAKSTGVKLRAEDIPQELIEAKRLHVLIQREVRDANQRP